MATQGHRVRDPVEDRPRDLLDEIDLTRHVARTPGRDGDLPVVRDVEPKAFERLALVARRDVEPDHSVRSLGPEPDDPALGEPPLDVGVPGHARAAEVDDHPARELRSGLREVRVDAFLPAVRACRPERVTLGAPEDPERLEVRRLEQHVGRKVRHLALLAAHDRRECDGPLRVRDHEVGGAELTVDAVERPQSLTRPCSPDDDPPARELRAVEHVKRASPHVHHVVRDVDDVRDRAHVREVEPRAEPLWRRTDRDVAEHSADVARAALEIFDPDVDRLLVDDGRILGLGEAQLAVEERRHLARDSHHREEVDAIRRGRDVEDPIPDRQHVDERRAGLDPAGEHHDPGVVVAETDLVLGEDHSPRCLAAKLALVERRVEDGQERAGKRDRNRGSGLEVPGTAHDLARVALPYVDAADAQPVRVRMRLDVEHRPHEEAAEIAVEIGDADVANPLDVVERGDGESTGDFLRRRVDGDVLPEPGQRDAHQNCLLNRGSFCQSSRRSGIPCRSTAIRSRPQPNANPV